MTSRRPSARSIELLRKVAATGLDHATIAAELVVTEARLSAYLEEAEPMPLDRQLCLAQLVIERVPSLSRMGHRLRGQVRAALAFNGHVTVTHADAPPLMGR